MSSSTLPSTTQRLKPADAAALSLKLSLRTGFDQKEVATPKSVELPAALVTRPAGPRRVAFVHEWLTTYAGSERILEQMLAVFPDADLFVLVDFLPNGQRLPAHSVRTSFIQKLPFARRHYRSYLPLMPFAVEQFDLTGYDLVISSSHAVAKGVITGPDQLHVCMCYSPIRYAWDLQHAYLEESGLTSGIRALIARWLLHKIRIWDVRTANGVNQFIAISNFIARRIQKVYGRESTVIYPPVDTDQFSPRSNKEEFYLVASRMVPYKKTSLIVEAFRGLPDKKLIVIGDGPKFEDVRRNLPGNVTLLGFQPNPVLTEYMQRARAFVFAAEEDFGIVCVEAQACGTPVIAYGKGGALETISGLNSAEPTGVFFDEQSIASIQQAIQKFERERGRITPEACRRNALRFGIQRFRSEFSDFIAQEWANFSRVLGPQ
jgi:glycosyltransferase involved in cell wall biosynthesis